MNRILILIFVLLLSSLTVFAQSFSFEPAKPVQGEEIEVKFNPEGTALAHADKIQLYCYTYGKDLNDAESIDMEKDGEYWTGSFTTGEKDLGALIIFKNEDVVENNKQSGYAVHIYDKSGEMLPGSLAGLGYAYYAWASWYLGFDRNPMLATELFNKEFSKNPSLKSEYVKYYVPAVSTVNRERAQEIIKEGAQLLEGKSELTDDDYLTLVDYYTRLKDSLKVNQFEKAAIEKYPDGVVSQMKSATAISILIDEEKIKAVKEFAKKYPDSRYLPSMHNSIIKYYMESGNVENLKIFFLDNKEDIDPYYFQNTALQLVEKKTDPQIILAISSAGIDALTEEIKTEKKPEYLTEDEWTKSKNERTGQALYAKGRVLYESGRIEESLELLQDAAENLNFQETEVNFYLSKALTDLGKYDEALNKTSDFIKEGNSSEEMVVLLKKIYSEVKGSDNSFSEYLAGLEDAANKKLAAKLLSEMIKEPAPVFRLSNLEGNEFSLEQFKGKIVIIDFWATWCGPCKSSFPGLKKIVEKYSGNEGVNFLFINSWERVDNKKENAQKFISENKYPFNVLLDLDNQVIEKYKVSGIPTKFIIDKKGDVRFKSIGYSGDNNKMIAELNAMISILNKE